MSSTELKEKIIECYGGNIKDWKRISKKKSPSGLYLRSFTNDPLGDKTWILSDDNTNDISFMYHNIPSGFIICLPVDISCENVDENVDYYKLIQEQTGDISPVPEPEDVPYVMFNTGDDDDIEDISDQQTDYYIEKYFGISLKNHFYETMENTLLLNCNMTVGNIREYFENLGLDFLGYSESDF